MIAVVDTKVLLSAALRDRLPEQVVLYVAMRDEWNGLSRRKSWPNTWKYCSGLTGYPKTAGDCPDFAESAEQKWDCPPLRRGFRIGSKFRLSAETLGHWADLVAMRTVNIGSPPATAAFSRDPKDAPFLAAALAGRADYLITGDRDLLSAKGVVPARILKAAEFARQFGIG
jgi:predicted nucleic acid-binding protein